MKFMVTYKVSPENFKEVMARLKARGREEPQGVKSLGRWHETHGSKGYVLFEVEDMVAFTGLLLGWSDLSDQTVVPVVEDEGILQNL